LFAHIYATLLSGCVLTGLDNLIAYAQTEMNRIASIAFGTQMWSFIFADLLFPDVSRSMLESLNNIKLF